MSLDTDVTVARSTFSTDWVGTARSLNREFWPVAAERERRNEPPHDELAKVRQSGLVNLLIPADLGGEGGTWLDVVRVLVELSQADPNIGALLAYHYHNYLPPVLDHEGRAAEVQRRSAAGQWLWGHITQPLVKDFHATPQPDGGLVINGTKPMNTGPATGDVMVVLARRTDRPEFIYSYIPTDRQGLTYHHDWDHLGLRRSATSAITFDNVVVHPHEVLVRNDPSPFVTIPPYYGTNAGLSFGAVYLGAAIGVLHEAKRHLRSRSVPHPAHQPAAAGEAPFTLAALGELWARIEAARAQLDHLARRYDEAWATRPDASIHELAALRSSIEAFRAVAARLGIDAGSKVFELVGASVADRSVGIDRYWRDVRIHCLHGGSPILVDRNVGDHYVNGRTHEFVLFDQPSDPASDPAPGEGAAIEQVPPDRPTAWQETARALAEQLAATANERDRQGGRPVTEVQALKDAGLVNLLVPTELGGEGGTLGDAVQVVHELSRGDASVGALLAFHYYVSAVPRLFDPLGEAADLVRRSAEGRWLWANVHQPRAAGFVAHPDGRGGYRIRGTKRWNTGITVADVTSVVAHRSDAPELLFAVVPTDRAGIRLRDDWDHLGLRATETVTVDFDEVEVRPDEVLHSTVGAQVSFPPLYAAFTMPLYAAIFTGSAQAALDGARQALLRRTSPRLGTPDAPTANQVVLAHFGAALGRVEAATTFVEAVAGEVWDAYERRLTISDRERGEVTQRAYAARAVAAQVALDTTPTVYDLTGTAATANAVGLDRHWRDVRTLSLHDPLVLTLRNLGDFYLNGTVNDLPAFVS